MDHHNNSELRKNLAKAAENAQLVLQEFLKKNLNNSDINLTLPTNIGLAFFEILGNLALHPEKIMKFQLEFYRDYMRLLSNISSRFLGEAPQPIYRPLDKDRRFQDEVWNQNAIFDFIKQSYLLTSNWLLRIIDDVEGLDKKDMHKLEFYTKQFIDAMAPSNFAMTNPQVIKATIDSKGENLVKGLQNLLNDLEKSKDSLTIKQTDSKAFKIGNNLAATKGKVIYQNDLMQLIQYEPTTKEVYKIPLLIVPAWINKFYILDMRQDNSFVKWLVDQGFTVFMISWVNPDAKLAKKTFQDYMEEGPLTAFNVIEEITGEKECGVIAYCLGGTLLSATLAYLAAKGIRKVKSISYLTTLVDFSDAGDLEVFIDEEQVRELEQKMSEKGYLDGSSMAQVFNMLRANDLIWSFVVNNYLLGKEPFPFDLLYWNSDSTRMPALMHSFYLRNMYQKNMLVKPGGIKLKDVPIDLRNITVPTYILSTREDHIAPWKSTFIATKLYKGLIKFVLSASGHVAGVINPAGKSKYSYWTYDNDIKDWGRMTPDGWFKDAKEHQGSWWPNWLDWQKKFAGAKVEARKPGNSKYKPIEDAPGSYVKVKYL